MDLDERITVTPIVVRSTDMDASRHVNNAVYFQYCEQGRIHHLRRLGVFDRRQQQQPGADERGGMVVGEARCRFIAPSFYGDVLDVRTRTREVRHRSFALSYEIVRQSDGALIAQGDSVQVWLGPDGRSAPIPDAAREILERSIIPDTSAVQG
jgi:acyl-CoA thioester hydrolase